jgi:NAD(P)-dependent dehydrogenase (short-subunit alcohol dehydrogenase family)
MQAGFAASRNESTMTEKTLMVVGAAGDVGRGVVSAALASGRRVVACGRSSAPLAALRAAHDADRLACVTGSIAGEDEAQALWDGARQPFGAIGDVVISVNSGGPLRPLLDWDAASLNDALSQNLTTHLVAARTFLARLPADGVFLGIGGGTADVIFPGMAHFSIIQAGLRMFYRALGKERRDGPRVRELMIVSMVNGASSRDRARPEWLTDEEIGRHVCAILDAPDTFSDTILKLQSREQVGMPDARG